MKKRIGTLLVLVLVFALVISGCGETTTPEKVDNNDQGQENENQQPAEKFNVGDTVKMGDLHFTLWEFIFEPNVFGFGQAIFDISVDEVN